MLFSVILRCAVAVLETRVCLQQNMNEIGVDMTS